MKIASVSLCYNMVELVPFYLRHYGPLVDVMHVWDDHSTDGSRELLAAHPKVLLHDWPYDTGIDEDRFLAFAYEMYPQFAAEFEWVLWPDLDEFLWHKDLRTLLVKSHMLAQAEVIMAEGFNMMAPAFPVDDGKSQIYDLVKTGVRAPIYNKPIIFRPSKKIRWTRGKHQLESVNTVFICGDLKLLHYRYLGFDYTKQRNHKNLDRCGLKTGDKGCAWSCTDQWKGEGSPEWAADALINHAYPIL